MATVTRENIGLLNDKITVRIEKDDYLSSFEKSLKNFSKNANIPGFRKGMVPTGMIKKMHGQAVFADEVLRSVEKELTTYMQNEKLEIFAQPLPLPDNDSRQIDMNNPKEYDFSFEIGLKPEFTLPELSELSAPMYKVDVTDEMVNEELDRLQTRQGKLTEPEAVENEENVLNVTFTESDKDGNLVEGASAVDNSLLVKHFTPAVRAELMGRKKDETITIYFPAAFEEAQKHNLIHDLGLSHEEAGQDKYFSMKITKVGHIEKAELNEDLFKAVYPQKEISNEADLRNAVREEMQQYWDSQSRNHLQHEVYHLLIDKTEISFPEEFLKKWLENNGEQQKTREQVDAEVPAFINQLKWNLITDEIMKQNNFEVNPDDLKTFAKKQLFSYMGMNVADEEQPWINDYLNKMMSDKKFVEDSYNRIITEKLFEWAETKVKKEEKPVSVADFTAELQKHQHHQH